MACAVFGRGGLMDLLAEVLPALGLARLCSASTRFYSQAAALAFASARAQHGLMIPDASLAEMHALDSVLSRTQTHAHTVVNTRSLRLPRMWQETHLCGTLKAAE